MQIEQTRWMQGRGWIPAPPGRLGANAQLVLIFGSPACLEQNGWQDVIEGASPNAHPNPTATCELHNQTMTITTLSEV